ncbi:MAG TPA: MFS transporter [Thermomicrobiaceae bacterium]|nr:MFS transporter [Thermomicrobiaceae bacterium]
MSAEAHEAHLPEWLLPADASRDAAVLIAARTVRAFGDGFVSVLLPLYLTQLGFSSLRIGAVATTTLLGSAALTLVVGLQAYRLRRRPLLTGAALLMAATGLGFASIHSFWPLLLVAFVGTLNPSAGDVSIFLPLEQALLPQTVSDRQRTSLFARYGLAASLSGAIGALAAGLPALAVAHSGISLMRALQGMFLLYGLLALIALLLYRRLTPAIEPHESTPASPLRESKRIVYTMAALFSLDSFGGGFVVQSLLALWLFERFHLSAATAGTIFFWSGVLSAVSYPMAARIARKIGLVRTMVFSHLPSNLFLILVPLMPSLAPAIALLLVRSFLSQMDVPTRNSYVMAVVSPAERPAAASVTSVPRSLATASSPLLSGWLLGLSAFGWPLVIGGALKAIYDLLLLAMFASVRPPEESGVDRHSEPKKARTPR